MKVSINNADHYKWGSNCDGWHLVKSDSLSVIQEIMPSGTSEVMHYHQNAQQFFYILKGTATFVLNGSEFSVSANEGFQVPKGDAHKICNNGSEELHFIVISEPKSHGDRVNLE